MTRVFTEEQVRARITERITRDGYRTTAKALGTNPGNLHAMIAGTRTLNDAVLKGMEMQWAIVAAPRSATPTPNRG